MNVDKIITGIAGYIENEFIRNLPAKSPGRVAVGAGVTLYLLHNREKIHKFFDGEGLKAFGLVKEDGGFNAEELRDQILRFMTDDGIEIQFAAFIPQIKTIPIIGNMINNGTFPEKITLYKQDVQKIFEYIIENI